MLASLVLTTLIAPLHAEENQWNTRALQRMMQEWDVKLEKMELHLQPAMLSGTSLIAFLPISLARQGQKSFGLTIKPCPFELPKLSLKSLWHERNQNDPVHQWVRETLTESFDAESVADIEVGV